MPVTAVKYAGTVADGGGTIPVTNPTNAQGAPDGALATADDSAIGGGHWNFNGVQLIKGGSPSGANKSDGSQVTVTVLTWKDFSFDLSSSGWNLVLTDQDVRASNFGGQMKWLSTHTSNTAIANSTNPGFTVADVPSFATIANVLFGVDIEIDPLGGSFDVDRTWIATPCGPVLLAAIKVGDQVLSCQNGRIVVATVTAVSRRVVKDVIEIIDDAGNVAYPTPGHRFFTEKKWEKIINFKKNQTLYRLWDNLLVPVKLHSIDNTGRPALVGNLTVAGTKNFFANGFLVHNGTPPVTFGIAFDAFRWQITYNEPGKKSPQLNQSVKRGSLF